MGILTIYFFGGYRSTHDDVMAWKNSLEAKLPGAKATAFHYPDGASAGDPLASWKASPDVAREIAGAEQCVIVGHSSGCAIANDVATHVLRLGKSNFRLIALDGFCPDAELLALPGTACWSAECDGVRSLNYGALEQCGRFHVYKAPVTERWPLHFSLVNLKVDDNYDSITDGYRRCDANLEVLGVAPVQPPIIISPIVQPQPPVVQPQPSVVQPQPPVVQPQPPVVQPPVISSTDTILAVQARITRLENMIRTAPPAPPPQTDLTVLVQQLMALIQASKAQSPPSLPVPATPAQAQDQLRQLSDLLNALLGGAGQATTAAAAAQPKLGQVNGALGQTIGNLLDGKKSAIGIVGALATSVLQSVGPDVPLSQIIPAIGSSVGLGSIAMPLFLALSAWGVLGKMEKWAQGTAPPPQPPK
jgi:hypothetical protein